MKTITTTVYTFDELTDTAKEKARQWYLEGAFDYEWWDSTYEDAKMIGLEIEEFDIDRGTIGGKLFKSVSEVCAGIVANHGKQCDTYKLAQEYYRRKKVGQPYEEKEFLHDLLEEYLAMLRDEAEYMMSDESVDENIRANEYTFTADGKREG